MAAGPWVFTNTSKTKLLNGTFRIGVDTFKVALLKSTSNISTSTTAFSGVTNECSTGGYVAGGAAITLTLSGTTTVTVTITANPSWTVTSTPQVKRFACIYEVGGDVLCYCLLDSTPADVSTPVGDVYTLDITTSGLFSF
jgi:hypothetical protein